MLEHWNKPIVLELTQPVIDYYTSFFGSPCDKLLNQIGELRNKLSFEGIILPHVHVVDTDELNGRAFRFSFSACNTIIFQLEAPSITPLTKLEEFARYLMMEGEPSQATVLKTLNDAIVLQQNLNYNLAIELYRKVYYWSCVINRYEDDSYLEKYDVFFAAVYNMGYIHFLNNRYGEAIYCGEVLLNIVDKNTYSNIAEKYLTHIFLANLYWLQGDAPKALSFYQKSIVDVQHYSGSKEPIIYSTWSLAFASLQSLTLKEATYNNIQIYDLCRTAFGDLLDLLASLEEYRETALHIAMIHKAVCNKEIAILRNEVSNLQKKMATMQKTNKSINDLVYSVGACLQIANSIIGIYFSIQPKTVTKVIVIHQYVTGLLKNTIFGQVNKINATEYQKRKNIQS